MIDFEQVRGVIAETLGCNVEEVARTAELIFAIQQEKRIADS